MKKCVFCGTKLEKGRSYCELHKNIRRSYFENGELHMVEKPRIPNWKHVGRYRKPVKQNRPE